MGPESWLPGEKDVPQGQPSPDNRGKPRGSRGTCTAATSGTWFPNVTDEGTELCLIPEKGPRPPPEMLGKRSALEAATDLLRGVGPASVPMLAGEASWSASSRAPAAVHLWGRHFKTGSPRVKQGPTWPWGAVAEEPTVPLAIPTAPRPQPQPGQGTGDGPWEEPGSFMGLDPLHRRRPRGLSK